MAARRYGPSKKKPNQLIQHFRKRWFERISSEEPPLDKIHDGINSRRWQGRKQTNTRTEFDFLYNGHLVTVIYNKKVGCVCTVLPINHKANKVE